MLRIESLTARLGGFTLRVDELEAARGEYLVVLGPSGVGKTVLINVVAGFIAPEEGRVLIDGRDATRLPPEERGVALVPQDYGLFPHMSVYDNIAYGLRMRGLPRAEVDRRVRETAGLLGISHLLRRRPSTLSGGERQRAALARAIAVEPRLILLDEPLSALDPRLRASALELLRGLHSRLGFTALHVTHSLLEALLLADRIGYMEGGRLVYTGTPGDFLSTGYAAPYLEEARRLSQALSRLGAGP